MNAQQKEKGFTIIEVVLVLAIAGLIFLMVFIAVPALQRNQRDTQRKNDLSRAQTAVTSYSSNNRNALPTDWGNFRTQYLTVGSDTFIDPSGATSGQDDKTAYTFVLSTDNLSGKFDNNTQNIIYYSTGYICGTSNGAIQQAGNTKVALRVYLEGGGVHCVNN